MTERSEIPRKWKRKRDGAREERRWVNRVNKRGGKTEGRIKRWSVGRLRSGASSTSSHLKKPSVSASARMTGEMVVTSTGQMTCFIWMFSTADGQADESRHIRGMERRLGQIKCDRSEAPARSKKKKREGNKLKSTF